MEDSERLGRIGKLIDEEHELYHRAEKGELGTREHERLRQLEVNLGPVLGPPRASPGTQRGGLRP